MPDVRRVLEDSDGTQSPALLLFHEPVHLVLSQRGMDSTCLSTTDKRMKIRRPREKNRLSGLEVYLKLFTDLVIDQPNAVNDALHPERHPLPVSKCE